MNHPLFSTLPPVEQHYLMQLDERYHFSFQQQRQLIVSACDLAMWQLGPLEKWIDEEKVVKLQGKAQAKTLVADHLNKMQQEREKPTNYQDFNPDTRFPDKFQ